MSRYLLSIYQPEGDPPPTELLEPVMQRLHALRDEMIAAGAFVFTGGLHPPKDTKVLRIQEGRVLKTDGPFIESKEFIGGFWIIEAPDIDHALEWARKAADALSLESGGAQMSLPIEVRAFQHAPQ